MMLKSVEIKKLKESKKKKRLPVDTSVFAKAGYIGNGRRINPLIHP